MLSDLVFDRATIRHKLIEFKIRWRGHIDQWKAENRPATESSHDQQFWGDLLACFGVNARDLYLYQRSAKRASTGHTGKIDMFIPGKVIGEAKSLGIDLDKAHEQALDYLLGGTIPNSQMPPMSSAPTSRLCASPALTASTSETLQNGTLPSTWTKSRCCCNLGREPRKLRFYCVINAMCLCCQAVSNTRLTITASGFG